MAFISVSCHLTKCYGDVRVQLSLFALLADCVIPLYCLLAFSLKNKQTVYCSLEKDRQCFLHLITSQEEIYSGTLIFTLLLIVTSVLLFYEHSFSLLFLLTHYTRHLLCIVKSNFIYDILHSDNALCVQAKTLRIQLFCIHYMLLPPQPYKEQHPSNVWIPCPSARQVSAKDSSDKRC